MGMTGNIAPRKQETLIPPEPNDGSLGIDLVISELDSSYLHRDQNAKNDRNAPKRKRIVILSAHGRKNKN